MFVRKKQRMARLVILAILLTMVAWIPAVPQESWAAETNENEVTYAVEGGNIYFNKETGTIVRADKEITQAEIPATIDDVEVSNIGEAAFMGCKNLSSITMPSSIKKIETGAFYYSGLKNIVIPEGVTSIGYMAFLECENLESIYIPSSVTTIEDRILQSTIALKSIEVAAENETYVSVDGVLFDKGQTKLMKYPAVKADTSYSIPKTVISIEDAAFDYCSNLTNVTIPEGVRKMGNNVFVDCPKLKEVLIPASMTESNFFQFAWNCPNLTKGAEIAEDNPAFSSQDGVIFNKDKTTLICYPTGLPAEEYTIPDGVICLEGKSFDRHCILKTLHIPASVMTIDRVALLGGSLTEVTVDEQNEHWLSKEGVLLNKDTMTVVFYNSEHIVIPEEVSSLGINTLAPFLQVKTVTLPASMETFGDNAFDAGGLERILVAEENKYYAAEDGVLFNKDKTTLIRYPRSHNCLDYVIPETVTSIEGNGFADCRENGLIVTVPDHVSNIHEKAFSGYRGTIKGSIGSAAETYAKAHNLNFVDINAEEPSQPTEPTTEPTEPTTPSVPPSEPSAEPTTPAEPSVTPTTPTPTEPVTKPTEPSVTPTEPSADPENPTTPEQPSVTTPTEKPSAPVQTTKPGTIVQDTNSKATYMVTKTGNGAGKNTVTYQKLKDTKKTAVVIPATVKIAGKAYQVTKIANNAFKNNTKVKTIKIGANIQTIGANAFNKCTKLTSITIPNKVTTIQKGAFANCKNLKSITIKTTKLTKKSIGKNAFKGIPAKTTIKVPKGKVKEYKKILQARGLSKNVKVK